MNVFKVLHFYVNSRHLEKHSECCIKTQNKNRISLVSKIISLKIKMTYTFTSVLISFQPLLDGSSWINFSHFKTIKSNKYLVLKKFSIYLFCLNTFCLPMNIFVFNAKRTKPWRKVGRKEVIRTPTRKPPDIYCFKSLCLQCPPYRWL